METVAEYVDGLPNLCGQETLISEAIETGRQRPVFPGGVDIERVVSGFAVALHMHQPIISGSGWGRNGASARACAVPRGTTRWTRRSQRRRARRWRQWRASGTSWSAR